MTRLVVLDLDGTLVDTPSAIVEAFTLALASVGAHPCDEPAIRATIGLPLAQAFADLTRTTADDAIVVRLVERYQALFREVVLPMAGHLVFPGVAEGLNALKDEGIKLAVATSKVSASADALLREAGLRDRFATVVGADQVRRPKPSPDTAYRILRYIGVSADRAVMVGDTTHDLLMARAVGMNSVAVTYGVHSVAELQSADPTWLADTFGDVVDCVRAAPVSHLAAGTGRGQIDLTARRGSTNPVAPRRERA